MVQDQVWSKAGVCDVRILLLALDWTMREATAGKRRGIRWNFTTVLEDLDFADNTAQLAVIQVQRLGRKHRVIG